MDAAAIGTPRVVARMRERGHLVADIARATEEGRLALGFLEELFPSDRTRVGIEQAARGTGLDEALVARLVSSLGASPDHSDTVSEDEVRLLRYVVCFTSTSTSR